jgi:hypothetical protein
MAPLDTSCAPAGRAPSRRGLLKGSAAAAVLLGFHVPARGAHAQAAAAGQVPR